MADRYDLSAMMNKAIKSAQSDKIRPRARGDLAGEIMLDVVPTLEPAATHQVTGRTTNQAPLSVLFDIVWSSSDEGVATVDQDGLVTAIEDGTTVISADGGGVVGTTTVTVFDTTPAAVVVTPATATLAAEETEQLTAVVNNQFGNPIPGETVTWASESDLIATVSAAGLVTAVATGEADITATSVTNGALSDLCVVTVS